LGGAFLESIIEQVSGIYVSCNALFFCTTFAGVPDEKIPLSSSNSEAIPLPDIKETLKKKEEEERYRIEEEKLKEKRRIKRSDKEAFTRVSDLSSCKYWYIFLLS